MLTIPTAGEITISNGFLIWKKLPNIRGFKKESSTVCIKTTGQMELVIIRNSVNTTDQTIITIIAKITKTGNDKEVNESSISSSKKKR